MLYGQGEGNLCRLASEAKALLDGFDLLLSSLHAALVAAGTLERGILHLSVELDLRLSAAGAHADLCAVFAEPLEHVRSVWHVELLRVAICILSLKRLIILPQADLRTTQFLRRVLAEIGHHLLDLVGTGLSGTYDIDGHLAREAILGIDVHQQVIERHAVILGPCCDLADKADGGWAVLVPDLVEGQESERLFAATDVLLHALILADLVGNPLEACVAVAQLHAVLLGNLGDDLSGDDGLYEKLVALQLAELLLVGDDVPAEHHAGLVAVEYLPLALGIAADDGQTVSIWVGGDDQISIKPCAELHAECHGFRILGVGADNGGEIAVDDHLLRDDVNILEAP